VTGPLRTCVGCRRATDKAQLVRLVWQQAVVVDLRQRQPGRGAYLHPTAECFAQAVRRRSLGRALRVSGVDPEALRRHWAEQGLPEVA
jgi:predicted RNA-binding protein YlxR (DUF448 family)